MSQKADDEEQWLGSRLLDLQLSRSYYIASVARPRQSMVVDEREGGEEVHKSILAHPSGRRACCQTGRAATPLVLISCYSDASEQGYEFEHEGRLCGFSPEFHFCPSPHELAGSCAWPVRAAVANPRLSVPCIESTIGRAQGRYTQVLVYWLGTEHGCPDVIRTGDCPRTVATLRGVSGGRLGSPMITLLLCVVLSVSPPRPHVRGKFIWEFQRLPSRSRHATHAHITHLERKNSLNDRILQPLPRVIDSNLYLLCPVLQSPIIVTRPSLTV